MIDAVMSSTSHVQLWVEGDNRGPKKCLVVVKQDSNVFTGMFWKEPVIAILFLRTFNETTHGCIHSKYIHKRRQRHQPTSFTPLFSEKAHPTATVIRERPKALTTLIRVDQIAFVANSECRHPLYKLYFSKTATCLPLRLQLQLSETWGWRGFGLCSVLVCIHTHTNVHVFVCLIPTERSGC